MAAALSLYTAEAFLLDGPTPGSGEAFDWTLACGLHNIILAGGLGPDNVADAIRRVTPWGVDACSRLERCSRFERLRKDAALRKSRNGFNMIVSQPDAGGHFGPYGGRYVPEVLMAPLEELEQAYCDARKDALSKAS